MAKAHDFPELCCQPFIKQTLVIYKICCYHENSIKLRKPYGGCYVTVKRLTFKAKHYDHATTERAIQHEWQSDAIKYIPSIQSDISKPHFSIPMPPPNITGELHLGHAIFLSIQDCLIRFYAQRGTNTHWTPGLDHAGLATHEKIEQKLQQENHIPYDKKTYLACGEALANLNRGKILNQFKSMGIACDWSQIKYTLDEQFRSLTIYAFNKLILAGKIQKKDGSYFLDLNAEANELADAIECGEITINSEPHKNRLLSMLRNHREWDIARKNYWGIPIPGEDDLTFDTSFTSSLYALATNETGEVHDLLETGYDILYFWAARMLMISKFLTGRYSFKNILLHGLLRDKNNIKFSKSLGNGINPLDLMDSHGIDAIRIYCIQGIEMGADSKFNQQKLDEARKNLQKIYSCGRLLYGYDGGVISNAYLDESDIRLQKTFESLMLELRLKEALFLLLDEFKSEFCNQWIQSNKETFCDLDKLSQAKSKFRHRMLLLHPFIPHITTWLIDGIS